MDLTLELSLTFLSSLDYLIIFPPAHTRQRAEFSGSWQQGHSATYNTPPRFKSPAKDSTRRRGNNNSRRSERRSRTDLANDTRLWEPAPTEDVPPQPNSPPDNVLRSIDPPASLDLKEGVVTPPRFTE
ncbi:hypothetical protein Bca4012_103375 [Brassica carinata]